MGESSPTVNKTIRLSLSCDVILKIWYIVVREPVVQSTARSFERGDKQHMLGLPESIQR
jgi:hypothetical protein